MSTLPKIAVIGCGHWGKNHVRNMAELGALAYVADANLDVAQKFAQDYHVTALRPEEVAKSDAAGAVIATPAQTHYDLAHSLMDAGKDVLVEKPICLDIAQADALITQAAEQNRIAMVGHLLQYHPIFMKVREIVESGALGKIGYIHSTRRSHGQIRSHENVWWSFAPHDVSMVLSLTKAAVTKVTAQHHSVVQNGISDMANAQVSFEDGLRADITTSWLNPFKEQKLIVTGGQGMLVFDDTLAWEDKLMRYATPVAWENETPRAHKADAMRVEVANGEPLRNECQHFIDCIISRETPRTDAVEARAVLDVLMRGDDPAQKTDHTNVA